MLLLNMKSGFNLGPDVGKLSGTPAGDTLISRKNPASRPFGYYKSTAKGAAVWVWALPWHLWSGHDIHDNAGFI